MIVHFANTVYIRSAVCWKSSITPNVNGRGCEYARVKQSRDFEEDLSKRHVIKQTQSLITEHGHLFKKCQLLG